MLALAACLVGVSGAGAATNRWEPYPPGVGGPWGGNVRRLVSPDPATGVLWAATAGGVYHSNDGGDHWAPRSAGLQSFDVTDLGVCAADPAVLIAATGDRGVHLSADGGASWSRVPASAMAGYPTDFSAVAVDPGDCTRMFAASLNGPDKLYESVDGGASWHDLGDNPVTRLVFAPSDFSDPWALYFATRDGKVFRYGPGDTWPVWIHTFPSTSEIVELVVPGGDGHTLVAAQGGAGLWVGSDGGNGWETPGGSNDDTWEERFFRGVPNDDFLTIEALAADPLRSDRIVYFVNDSFAHSRTALYESSDLAVSRSELLLPEVGMEVTVLASTAAAEWVGDSIAGLYRRVGASGPFSLSGRGLVAFTVQDLSLAGAEGEPWAVGGRIGDDGNSGVHRWSVAAGWERVISGLPSGRGSLCRREGGDLWVGIGGGLFFSADDGGTWAEKDTGVSVTIRHDLSDLALGEADASLVVLGTQGGVYHSADAGTNWVADADLPATLGWALEPDPFGGATGFFAAGNNGNNGMIFVTGDPTQGWTEVGAGAFSGVKLLDLAVSRDTSGHLFAGGQSQGAFESLDGGSVWTAVGDGFNGFPRTGKASSVAMAVGSADQRRAAVVDGTVHVTTDAGTTWTHVDTGLVDGAGRVPVILDLDFDPAGDRLVASVMGRGLWALDLAPQADEAPPVLTLIGPNPLDVELGGTYVEPGFAAVDTVAGDVRGRVTTVPADPAQLDTTVTGLATVRYDVCDPAGNCAPTQLRWVRIADTVGPVITLVGDDPLEWEAGTPYVDPGATAFDANDGDLSASVVADVSGVDVDALGVYPVTYDVSDQWGNPAPQVVRSVEVVDTTPPVITLVGGDPLPWEVDASPYVDPGAVAADALDGDLTGAVVTDATAVDPATPGDYQVTYRVTDGEGNTATATRTVHVADTVAPTITLLGDDPLAMVVGAAYVELGATAFDAHDGDVSASITIDASRVDVAAVGTYQVDYRVSDLAGNQAAVVRTVSITAGGSAGGGGGGGGGCFLGVLGSRGR